MSVTYYLILMIMWTGADGKPHHTKHPIDSYRGQTAFVDCNQAKTVVGPTLPVGYGLVCEIEAR